MDLQNLLCACDIVAERTAHHHYGVSVLCDTDGGVKTDILTQIIPTKCQDTQCGATLSKSAPVGWLGVWKMVRIISSESMELSFYPFKSCDDTHFHQLHIRLQQSAFLTITYASKNGRLILRLTYRPIIISSKNFSNFM